MGAEASAGQLAELRPASAALPHWLSVLRKLAMLPVASPDLATLRAYGCLGNRLFWARCFGCVAPPTVRGPRRAALGPRETHNEAGSDDSEDEIVTVHQFANRMIADYAPPATAGQS